MKRLSVILILAVPALLWNCSAGTNEDTAEGQPTESAQAATPPPDVDEAARYHARRLHPGAYTDSLQLHALLLDAAATRSKYELAGQKDKAQRFNEVFVEELRTVNPELAASLQQ